MRLAIIGFLGHAPGLRLFAGARLDRVALGLNLAAVGLTVVAMGVAGLVAERPVVAVAIAWAAGHFAWSCALVGLVFAGRVRSGTMPGCSGSSSDASTP